MDRRTPQPANKKIRADSDHPGDPHDYLHRYVRRWGIHRSMDSGVTWSTCTNTGLANLNVLSLVTNSTGGLYAGTENGVFASTDCAIWTAVNNGLPA